MVSKNKIITGAAAVVTAGSLAFAGASLASADTPTDTPSGTATSGTTQQGDRDNDGRGGGRGGHDHTEVTGAEATKVTAAVTTTGTVKVESVMKDPDGSYDVRGTKDGERVMVEVSSDLKTVEVRTGGGMGRGGHGGGGHGERQNLTEVNRRRGQQGDRSGRREGLRLQDREGRQGRGRHLHGRGHQGV